MAKSPIYTKAGDQGQTSLFGGGKISKGSVRVATYGSLDELNSALGLAASFNPSKKVVNILKSIQNELFSLGAEIAGDTKEFSLTENKVTELESWIDDFDSRLPKLTNFILPGGSQEASFLHQARTICRRAERKLVQLSEKEKLNPNILKYLNRLGDLLFVLARTSNGGKDVVWKK